MSHGLQVLICIDILMAIAIYMPLAAGDLSVLPVGTMAIGAYTFATQTEHGTGMMLATVEGVLLAVVVGFLAGLLMLRLTGFSAALASFGLVVVLQTALTNWHYVGGIQGIYDIVDFSNNAGYWLVTLVIVAGLLTIEFTRPGQVIRAIRTDRLGAECLGIRTSAIRLALYTASAAVSGYAGVLFASLLSYISPDLFSLSSINSYLVGAVMGGSTTVVGPVVGGTFVAAAPTWLAWLSTYRLLVYSLLLIAVLLVRREGVVTRNGLLIGARLVRRVLPWPGRPDHESAPSDESGTAVELPPVDPARLELSEIRKYFGGVRVLESVTLDAEPGQVTGIIGPNGAGKTTLLNIVSGVLSADRGSVKVDGREQRSRQPHTAVRAGIGRTFQNLRLFGDFTVGENLGLVSRKPAPYLAAVGLTGEENTRASSLPYGRQRLVEIARAMATRPRVLLLDEPTAGMTAGEVDEVARIVRTLREEGVTVVLIEHNMNFVRSICDKVFAITEGTVVASGSVEHVLNDPIVVEAYLGAPTVHAAAVAAVD